MSIVEKLKQIMEKEGDPQIETIEDAMLDRIAGGRSVQNVVLWCQAGWSQCGVGSN